MRWALLITAVCLALSFASEARASGTSTVTVEAVVLSKNKCKFNTTNATINFGNVDPGIASDVTINISVDIVCNGAAASATFSITDDDGMYFTGPNANRMKHATLAQYLDYTLTYTPTSANVAKGVVTPIALTGFLSGAAYAGAVPGTYSDTVILTIEP